MIDDSEIETVLGYWFGAVDERGLAPAEIAARWWHKDPAFDEELRGLFGACHAEVLAGQHDDWLASPRGRLAYVLVLDQLSRNLFRGTPAMFGGDPPALAAAKEGIARGDDQTLFFDGRCFLYMPLMHSEELADQDECVALFQALAAASDGACRERAEYSLAFARQHREIVARFGRFPHRNAVLGRRSSDEERVFLAGPGSSF